MPQKTPATPSHPVLTEEPGCSSNLRRESNDAPTRAEDSLAGLFGHGQHRRMGSSAGQVK
ncbi:MAG: hypothetical protein R3F31_17975 [Verrucomicrobiales bacterium]